MALRVANRIPAPNPNPRPPNEVHGGVRLVGTQPKAAVANNQVAKGNKDQHQKTPPKANPSGAGGGGGAQTPPSTQPAFAAPVDPRDAQYWREKAQLNYMSTIDTENTNAANAQSKIEEEAQLKQREYLEPRETQELTKGDNAGGLIYSTTHQERLGELGQQQLGQRLGITNAYQKALLDRSISLKEREGERIGNEGDILSGAEERAANNELNRPEPYTPAPNYTTVVLRNRAAKKPKKRK